VNQTLEFITFSCVCLFFGVMILLQEFLNGSSVQDRLHIVEFVNKHICAFLVHFGQLFVRATTEEESNPVYEANVEVMVGRIFRSYFGPRMHLFR